MKKETTIPVLKTISGPYFKRVSEQSALRSHSISVHYDFMELISETA